MVLLATLAPVVGLVALVSGGAGEAGTPKKAARDASRTASPTVDLSYVAQRARDLAAAPYRDSKGKVPDWLLGISYDQWRDIRFRSERALWADTPSRFQAQFFHLGLFYDRPVAINVVEPQGVRPLAFSPSLFDYGKNDFGSRVPQDLGFAGFRLHYPIKKADYRDEVIVFLGAAYFRALGRDQLFGLSARGLAIDTAEPWGEEFPWFREFWLVRPPPQAAALTLYALLDSPRVVGAYRFVVTPGEQTRVDVECRLFLRAEVQKLGLAPLTSMFFHGENTQRLFVDFRPEVHDSDGLLLNLGSGEWLWRPLDNPARLRVSAPRAEALAGFGLQQRDRNFDHYQDLEIAAERRPSVWQAPWDDWGPGRVELVEIPTDDDTNDNIVTYFVADGAPKPGQETRFGYTQWWYGDDPARPPGGRVLSTRRDAGTRKGGTRFVVDFVGGKLSGLPPEEVLRGVVGVAGGEAQAEVRDEHVVPNPHTGGWRLSFQVVPKTRGPVELRAFLERSGEVLTETWTSAIVP
jgi:glucans biosynthesis protein